MRYVSTRGSAPELGFADVLLAGLATDGGLYVPERWPTLDASTATTYVERAVEVMLPFVEPDIDELTLTHRNPLAAFAGGRVETIGELFDPG